MTREEAKDWYDRMPEEDHITILQEHYRLKQELCANVLIVATGAPDWVERSIKSAIRLREHKTQLRKIIHAGTALLEEASDRIAMAERECRNCTGSGVVSGRSCVCCNGTGTRRLG